LRRSFLLGLLSLSLSLSLSAHAQIAEAYATLAIDHPYNVTTPYGDRSEQSSYTAVGGTFGGTINFLNLHVLTVGIDARDTAAKAANIWLAGFRVQAKPPHFHFKPYFQLSVGEAHLHVPQNYDSSLPNPIPVDYYLYNASLGVDYRLTSFADFRVLEIGDGRTLGGGSTNPTSFLTINTGIVVHF
jgi:hypothetical protein